MGIGILIFTDKSEILVNNIYFNFSHNFPSQHPITKRDRGKNAYSTPLFFYKYANDLKLNVNVGHSLIRITINC